MASFQDISTLNFMRGSFFRWTTRAIVRALCGRTLAPAAHHKSQRRDHYFTSNWPFCLITRTVRSEIVPFHWNTTYSKYFWTQSMPINAKTTLYNVTLNLPRFIYTNDHNAQFSNNSVLSISSRGGRNLICSFCVVAWAAGSADGDHSVHFYFYVVNQSLRVMNVDLYVNGLCRDCRNFI